MNREQVRRWKENWDAVARVQREQARAEGPQPERAIRLSLP